MGYSIVYNDVSVCYDGAGLSDPVDAISGITTELTAGRFVAVVGQSGCGKTTLLNATAGLVPCSSGSIEFKEEALAEGGHDRGSGEARPSIVFQSPRLLPWMRVQKNVEVAIEGFLRSQGSASTRENIRCRAAAELDRVGIREFANAYPRQLSGGMQQRVNLARALAVDSSILLMDEPFAALDAFTRETMQGELLRLWQETSPTTLFITHQLDEALILADEVIVLSSRPGRVVKQLDVPFARPRSVELKRTPDFHELEDLLWTALYQPA